QIKQRTARLHRALPRRLLCISLPATTAWPRPIWPACATRPSAPFLLALLAEPSPISPATPCPRCHFSAAGCWPRWAFAAPDGYAAPLTRAEGGGTSCPHLQNSFPPTPPHTTERRKRLAGVAPADPAPPAANDPQARRSYSGEPAAAVTGALPTDQH